MLEIQAKQPRTVQVKILILGDYAKQNEAFSNLFSIYQIGFLHIS